MRLSRWFAPTLRDDPVEAEVASHRLLLRGGFIRQVSAGFWSFLRFDRKGRCGVEFDRLRARDWTNPSGLGWSLADAGFAVFRARRAPRTLALSAADPARLEVFNLRGHGYHGLVQNEFALPPDEAATTIASFALVPHDRAPAYRVLRGLTRGSFEATRPR